MINTKSFYFSVKKMHWGFLIAAQEVKKWCLLPVCIWSCVLEQIWVVAIEFLAWSKIMPTSVSSYLKMWLDFFYHGESQNTHSLFLRLHAFCTSFLSDSLFVLLCQVLFVLVHASELLCHLWTAGSCAAQLLFSSGFMFLLPSTCWPMSPLLPTNQCWPVISFFS